MSLQENVATFIREAAASEIIPRFRSLSAADIREKKPGDLVTTADLETERVLSARLAAALPGSVVLGEEAAAQHRAHFALLSQEAPVWVIDPVDGTANFARGQPGFAVIVALVERGVVRAGWIYDPLGDVMVTTEAGSGAWCDGKRLAVASEGEGTPVVGAAYGRAATGERAAKRLEASGRVAAIRNLGCSALEYVEIAFGRAQFSLHSRSLPWDHAAGLLITAEAGGIGGFLDGSAYDPTIIDRAVLASAGPQSWGIVREVVGSLV